MSSMEDPESDAKSGFLIVSDIRFPLERANGIQTVETAHALARLGHRVELVVRHIDRRHGNDPPLTFYGLPAHPNFTLTSLELHGRFARARFFGRVILRASQAAKTKTNSAGIWMLTRDLMLAEAVLALPEAMRPNLLFEAHTVSSVFASEKTRLYDGAPSPSTAKLKRLDKRESRVLEKASGVLSITRHLARALAERHEQIKPIEVVPDGCRIEEPPPEPPERHTGEPFHVMYVGQLYPWKGVDVLIEAMATLAEANGRKEYRLTIVGGLIGEPDHERVRGKIMRLGLDEMVTMEGFLAPTRLGALRARAQAFIVPNLAGSQTSEAYTSPLKLFESMASRRPIVASELPSLGEILRHEHNALLTPPGNAASLADAIRRLAEDEALSNRIATNAWHDVQEFSWEKRAARISAFIERLSAG